MKSLGWFVAGVVTVLWLAARREAQYWQDDSDADEDASSDAFAPLEPVTDVAPLTIRVSRQSSTSAPWYVASCGHAHAWGVACSAFDS